MPASAQEQSPKFWIKEVNKAAASATQFAKYILLHAYSRITAVYEKNNARINKNLISLIYRAGIKDFWL